VSALPIAGAACQRYFLDFSGKRWISANRQFDTLVEHSLIGDTGKR
jgi:hypothetical protein